MNNQIRFLVYDGDDLIQTTGWVSERTREDAPNALQKVREEHGATYKYRIERTGDSRERNTVNMIRFQIKIGDLMFYSKTVPENEREALLATLQGGEDLKWVGGQDLDLNKAQFTEVKV